MGNVTVGTQSLGSRVRGSRRCGLLRRSSSASAGHTRTKTNAGLVAVAVSGLLILAGCGGTTKSVTSTPEAANGSAVTASANPASAPSAQVVGPLQSPSSIRSLQHAEQTQQSMKQTMYSHTNVENTSSSYYQFDCVGFTDWNVRQTNPAAWTAMHDQLNIPSGYVPSPDHWYGFLTGPLPSSWQRITNINDVQPGDYWLFTSNSATKFVGHSAVTGGQPVALSDGSYAMRVFDSTDTAHGPYDSRLTDPRAINRSGLGDGTMRIYIDSNGNITSAAWSIEAGGPSMNGVQVAVGRTV